MGEVFKMFIILLNFLLMSVCGCRILGIVSIPSYSHQSAFYPLWKKLSLRGHQLTVLTTDPIKDPSLTNLTEIDLHFSYAEKVYMNMNEVSKQSVVEYFSKALSYSEHLLNAQLGHPQVQELIRNPKESFDLVLVEGFFPTMYAFAKRFNCPMIVIFSLDAFSKNYRSMGNPSHPILNPDFTTPYAGKLSFFERLGSVCFMLLGYLFNNIFFMPLQQSVAQKHFGDGYDLEEIGKNASMLFVNTNPVLHDVRPVLPNVIQIGGGMHITYPEPLPENLKKVLDDASNGFIYFSLGNNIKSKLLSNSTRAVLIETFSELPYTILWKFEEEDLPGKPNNVIIAKWFPQQNIFKHPNIKLFITQGGLQSIEEALFNHVPMVGMPFMGEQLGNVKRMVLKGLGLSVDYNRMDKTILKNVILEVINNPIYSNKVKKLAELARDQPSTGLERAVWWTEYVLRHKGANHFRSSAADLPLYQYLLLDVIGFCLTVLLIIAYIVIKILKILYKLIKRIMVRSKEKTQ